MDNDRNATALAVARKIEKRIDDALAPLITEMKIMRWPVDYQRIVFQALAHKAMKLAQDGVK